MPRRRSDRSLCTVVTNWNDLIQAEIPHETQVDIHVSIVIDLDAVDDPLELSVCHLPHIGDALDGFEGLIQDAFELVTLCEIIGHDLKLTLQPVDLLAHPGEFLVQFFPGDEIVGVHIHVLLAALFELGELLGQLFLIVDVFIFCLIDTFKFPNNISFLMIC